LLQLWAVIEKAKAATSVQEAQQNETQRNLSWRFYFSDSQNGWTEFGSNGSVEFGSNGSQNGLIKLRFNDSQNG
jgi:hypothetical protein